MHEHQKTSLALAVLGMVLSGTAVLPLLAERLSEEGISQAKRRSHERRLARFVANDRILAAEAWKQFVSQGLPNWQGKPVQLVLDGTPFSGYREQMGQADSRILLEFIGMELHYRLECGLVKSRRETLEYFALFLYT